LLTARLGKFSLRAITELQSNAGITGMPINPSSTACNEHSQNYANGSNASGRILSMDTPSGGSIDWK
jgi:hypothetical protein